MCSVKLSQTPFGFCLHSFFEANLGLTKELPDFNLFDNDNAIYTRARMLPPAKISGTTMDRTLVAEGSIINAAKIENCVIGIRSRIGHDSSLINTYMMGSDFYETLPEIANTKMQGQPLLGIGDRCIIKNAILDKNVRIGDDVKITGGTHLENADHPLYTIKDGIVVVKKGAVIPNKSVI